MAQSRLSRSNSNLEATMQNSSSNKTINTHGCGNILSSNSPSEYGEGQTAEPEIETRGEHQDDDKLPEIIWQVHDARTKEREKQMRRAASSGVPTKSPRSATTSVASGPARIRSSLMEAAVAVALSADGVSRDSMKSCAVSLPLRMKSTNREKATTDPELWRINRHHQADGEAQSAHGKKQMIVAKNASRPCNSMKIQTSHFLEKQRYCAHDGIYRRSSAANTSRSSSEQSLKQSSSLLSLASPSEASAVSTPVAAVNSLSAMKAAPPTDAELQAARDGCPGAYREGGINDHPENRSGSNDEDEGYLLSYNCDGSGDEDDHNNRGQLTIPNGSEEVEAGQVVEDGDDCSDILVNLQDPIPDGPNTPNNDSISHLSVTSLGPFDHSASNGNSHHHSHSSYISRLSHSNQIYAGTELGHVSVSDLDTVRSGLVSAKPVQDSETIFEAEDIKNDNTRQRYLIIIACAVIGIILSIAIPLTIIFTRHSGVSDPRDPRCMVDDTRNLIIPHQCMCEGHTGTAWSNLTGLGVNTYDWVVDLLHENSILPPGMTLNRTGCQPEHQGILFMASEVDKRIDQSIAGQIPTTSIIRWYSLTQFYSAMNGMDWTSSDGWFQPGSDLCDWTGISCVFVDIVQSITLPNNNLVGTLPSALFHLSSLWEIDLSSNEGISGTISGDIGSMTSLMEIVFTGMGLSGAIPSEMGMLSRLGSLALSGNRLTGEIPTELLSIPSIRILQLTNNSLTGPIPPEIGLSTRLVSFEVGRNLISGSLPAELTALSDLEVLDVSFNNFTNAPSHGIVLPAGLEFVNAYHSAAFAVVPPSMCNASLPHPGRRTLAVQCADDHEVVCDCCTHEYGRDDAMVFLLCGETIGN